MGLQNKRWMQRPMMGGTQWRINNMDRTIYSWGVKELEMYQDIECKLKVPYNQRVRVISSGYEERMYDWQAFDG